MGILFEKKCIITHIRTKRRAIMPEKKSGMTDFWRGVFKIKKPYYDDVVYQAEKIIADYVAKRRTEIISKYAKKKHRFLNFMIITASCAAVYLIYRISM